MLIFENYTISFASMYCWTCFDIIVIILQVLFLMSLWYQPLNGEPLPNPDNTDRTLDVGSRISGLVSGGFDKLGYIPVTEAVGMCEGQARFR